MNKLFFSLFLVLSSSLYSQSILRIASDHLETFDPRKANSMPPQYILRMLYETVVRLEPDGQLHPALAERIEVNPEKTEYTFRLRKSFWSDGSPFTAEDIVDSWKKAIVFVPSTDWYCIKNGEQVALKILPVDQLGVRVLDAQTFVVELERPIPYFFDLLVYVNWYPVKKELDEQQPDWASSLNPNYVCNGPFRIASGDEDSALFLEKNPHYWNQEQIMLDGIQLFFIDNGELAFNMFENGELDLIGTPFQGLNLANVEILQKKYPIFKPKSIAIGKILCNTSQYPFNNVHFRKALAYAIDRRRYCAIIKKGTPAYSHLLPEKSSGRQFIEDGNREKAQWHFDQFLKQHSQKERPKVILLCIADRQEVCEFFKEELEKVLSIEVELQLEDVKQFLIDINNNRYHMTLVGFAAYRFEDPMEEMNHYISFNPQENDGYWVDSALIRAIHRADEQTNPFLRRQLFYWAEEILMEEMPSIPLSYGDSYYAKNPALQGEYLRNAAHIDFRWAHFV